MQLTTRSVCIERSKQLILTKELFRDSTSLLFSILLFIQDGKRAEIKGKEKKPNRVQDDHRKGTFLHFECCFSGIIVSIFYVPPSNFLSPIYSQFEPIGAYR